MKPLPELHELVAPIQGVGEKEARRIAVEMGVPAGTLYRLILGYSEGCHYGTARKISIWLAGNPRQVAVIRRSRERTAAA